MTEIEDLKFAHKMTAQGEWNTSRHGTPDYAPQYGVYAEGSPSDLAIVFREADADFIALAHNLMPQLLKAVELLKEVDADFGYNRSQEKRLETALRIEQFIHGVWM